MAAVRQASTGCDASWLLVGVPDAAMPVTGYRGRALLVRGLLSGRGLGFWICLGSRFGGGCGWVDVGRGRGNIFSTEGVVNQAKDVANGEGAEM